jgi:predicted ATPase/Tfp pilus assembly protein PilF
MLLSQQLVTITGTGGIGKTRSALEVARAVRNRFDDGVWLVELGALADASLVPEAEGKELEVPEEPGQHFIETLQRHLASRRLLLVLDNCEHLLVACAQFAETLLAAAPQVRILATSRAALGISSETTYSLPPLSAPDTLTSVTTLARYESVQLFHNRAALRKPGFAVDDANAPAIADICRRLDGIPLAIELAAAHIRSLSVTEIGRRLDHRFSLLAGGGTGLLPRQQTLRALVDWSYDMLSEREKALFADLSVFAGGWTLDAAEAVGSDVAGNAPVVETLSHLVDQSLVAVERQGERYRLLETIREYASHRLAESCGSAAAHARHCDYFLSFAEQVEPGLISGAEQARGLSRLDLEHDNLRAVLEQSIVPGGDAERALRMCGALYRYWIHRGHLREGRAWCEKATALAAGQRSPAQAKALLGLSSIAYRQGDLADAQGMLESALSASRIGDDRALQARILNNLANIAHEQGDLSRARETYQNAAVLAREAGPKALEAMVLANLGNLHVAEGETDTARPMLERALALCQELDDRALMAHVLSYLENAAHYEGDFRTALALNEQVAEIARAMDYPAQIAQQLNGRAELLVAVGDIAAGRTLFVEALECTRQLGMQFSSAACFDSISKLAVALHEYERAARILGMADAIYRSIGTRRHTVEARVCEENVGRCRAALGETQTALAWAEGHALSVSDAIDETLTWLRE